MNLKTNVICCLLTVAIGFSSCISYKKTQYLKGAPEQTLEYLIPSRDIKGILPGDELNLRISSFDDVAYNFFSNQSEAARMTFNNELSIALYSYTVNDSGYIDIPMLGLVKVGGYTIPEVTLQLKDELASYFNQPVVVIKQVNKKITILGEVNVPGSHIYTKERLTIFDAIGMAGDIAVTGKKDEVYVIRENGGSILKEKLDLTNDQIFASDFYYLNPNDMVYVSPRKSASWRVESIPLTLVFSGITAFILIFNTIRDI